jgi:hypothetical protein
MLVVVLKDCVTDTNDTAWASNNSISLAKSASDIDLAGAHLGEQRLQGRAVERGAGEAAIVVAVGHKPPALAGLAGGVLDR